jgi:hypothetical protein
MRPPIFRAIGGKLLLLFEVVAVYADVGSIAKGILVDGGRA